MTIKEKKPKVKKEPKVKEKKVKKELKKKEKRDAVLSDINLVKIEVALDMYKGHLPLYLEYKKNDEIKLNYFLGMSRSIIFDITKAKFFQVGLISEQALKKLEDITHEHLYNRKLSARKLFELLEQNPNMTVEEFIFFLKKYGTIIVVTKSEHNEITKKTKGLYEKTVEDYENAGVNIPGLDEYIIEMKKIEI